MTEIAPNAGPPQQRPSGCLLAVLIFALGVFCAYRAWRLHKRRQL